MLLRSGAAALGLAWRSRRGAVLSAVALTLLGGLTPVATAWLTKLILDAIVAGSFDESRLVVMTAALGVLGIATATIPHAIRYAEGELDRGLRLDTQDRLYLAINRLQGLAMFEQPRFRDVLGLAREAGAQAPQAVVGGSLGIAQSSITVLSLLGALLVISPWMVFLVAAAAVPGLFLELALARRRTQLLWDTSSNTRRHFFYETLLTNLQAAKEVRVFGFGEFLRGRMLSELRTINDKNRQLSLRELRRQIVLAILGAAVAGLGLVWAVLEAYRGRLTIGDVSMFVAAVLGVQMGLAGVASRLGFVHEGLLRFRHYLEVVELQPDLPSPPNPRPLHSLSHGLELRGVWFRYEDDQPWVLRDVDLHIPKGQAVALVGRNGAGKSTLVKLICRMYDPTRGSILWDGVDLREFDVEQLRKRIGVVFQDFMTYDLTASENIGIGDLDALHERPRILAAAHLSGVHKTISALPRGYETLLSRIFFNEGQRNDPETGIVLSTGQGQRLALARGFMRQERDLLILDEPTSGLDPQSTHDLHERLRRYRSGKTSLLVSHRLDTVRKADLIVVLDEGVIERGTHSQLLAAGGEYARLFHLQASGYQMEDGQNAYRNDSDELQIANSLVEEGR